MNVTLAVALLVSAVALVLLGLSDPKRRRVARTGAGASVLTRRLLTALALSPSLLFAAKGEAAGFVIWLGVAALLGWIVATAPFGRRPGGT